ncbi:AAA family ATPase [Streptomyces sp. NPDC002057]|uniref:AAA family ATPase n=1 Tax=Streptomyces sp. NPDC002057 TaxID=3154664 RepID=UPI003322ACA4
MPNSSGVLGPIPSMGPVPSLATLHRAIRRDLTVGERAGLRNGEKARRTHDVFARRPAAHRNAVWEGDHKRVPVEVDVEGELVCLWVTWFIDCATKVIVGVAVTPHTPSRDAVLAALRARIDRREPYGPAGGLPSVIRVDRGKDFLSKTVTNAMGALSVGVFGLLAYTHLKGTIKALNNAVEVMHFKGLPRYRRRQRLAQGDPADPDAPALSFSAFVAGLLAWVSWWNARHRPAALDGKTPLEAWAKDPTPLVEVPAEWLARFALEDGGRERTITTNGIRWRRRSYIAAWMVGRIGTPAPPRRRPGGLRPAGQISRQCTAGQCRWRGGSPGPQGREGHGRARRLRADLKDGPAGYGKTMAVNSALRALAPKDTYRLELRSGPTPRGIRHGLFKALRLPGEPPSRLIEFDALLKEAVAERFRVLVCDEAQWMSRTGFEFWRSSVGRPAH